MILSIFSISSGDDQVVSGFDSAALAFKHFSPKRPLRITAAGLRTRSEGAAVAQATDVNERRVGRRDRRNNGATVALLSLCNRRDRVADGPSPKHRPTGGAMRKPAVIRCGGADVSFATDGK